MPVTTYPGSEENPALSPDGKQIAFSWDGEKGANPGGIYVKLLGETNTLRLTTGPDGVPVWSPDGKRIAFVRGEPGREIYTVSALGGPERKMAELPLNPVSPISWSPDGNWLLVSRGTRNDSAIFLLPVEGGAPRRITNAKSPSLDRAPAFAPDGHRFAYAGCTVIYSCDIYVQELGPDYSSRGNLRPITHQPLAITALTWTRDGGSLIYSARLFSAGCVSSMVTVISPGAGGVSSSFASPKSSTFTAPSRVTMILAGFRSR